MVNLSERVEPPSIKHMWRDLRALARRVEEVASAGGLVGRATVGDGGQLLVDGLLKVVGAVSMVSTDGTELFRIGNMLYGRGVQMMRDNGTRAYTLAKPFSNSALQQWSLFDRKGQQVVAEASIGPGLYRPHLEHPFQPVAAASGTAVSCGPYGWERTTSSTSWETLFAYDGKVQNGLLDLKLAAMNSDGATDGEVRVVDLVTGTPLAGFLLPAWVGAIGAGLTVMTPIDPDPTWILLPVYGLTQSVGDQMRLGIQVRRTTGTGSITLSVPQAIGG